MEVSGELRADGWGWGSRQKNLNSDFQITFIPEVIKEINSERLSKIHH